MAPDVEVVDPDDTLKTAAQFDQQMRNTSALTIGANNLLISVITNHDIAVRAVAERPGSEATVREAMSPDVFYCFETQCRRRIEESSDRRSGAVPW